jgi:hypothetical protein
LGLTSLTRQDDCIFPEPASIPASRNALAAVDFAEPQRVTAGRRALTAANAMRLTFNLNQQAGQRLGRQIAP